jgi:hypothetical protein
MIDCRFVRRFTGQAGPEAVPIYDRASSVVSVGIRSRLSADTVRVLWPRLKLVVAEAAWLGRESVSVALQPAPFVVEWARLGPKNGPVPVLRAPAVAEVAPVSPELTAFPQHAVTRQCVVLTRQYAVVT